MKLRNCIAMLLLSLTAAFTGCEPDQRSLHIDDFGMIGDSEVKLFSLTNALGHKAVLTNYGATLVSLFVPDKSGTLQDVILGYDDLQGYLEGDAYFGKTVGRYANRIARGKFSLEGKEYSLAINNPPNHLHGGPGGFSNVVWEASYMKAKEGLKVQFTYQSAHMEEGFPGNMDVKVVYTWTDEDELLIEYEATTDQPTLCNLTHHSLFNLSGAGNGDILDHQLMVNADAFTPVDSTLIPTGEIRPVEGTPFDFREATLIADRIEADHEQILLGKGIDHNFVLNEPGTYRLAACLYDPESGRMMEVFTNEPGIQVYTGNFLDGTRGHEGLPYDFRTGIALETQHFPDSPNKPEFPSVVLRPGEKYTQKTAYRFSLKEE